MSFCDPPLRRNTCHSICQHASFNDQWRYMLGLTGFTSTTPIFMPAGTPSEAHWEKN